MSTPTRLTSLLTFAGGVAVLCVLCPTCPPVGFARPQQERLIRRQSNPNEPATIATMKTKKGVVALDKVGRLLSDDEDWLKGLTVKVDNTSAKKINFVSVRLTFPRPAGDYAADRPPLMHSIKYGRDPFHLKDLSPTAQYDVSPGGTLEVALADDTYEMLRRVLKKLNYPETLDEVEIIVETVGFDDGTVWDMGTLLRRDADDPNKFIPAQEQIPRQSGRALGPADLFKPLNGGRRT